MLSSITLRNQLKCSAHTTATAVVAKTVAHHTLQLVDLATHELVSPHYFSILTNCHSRSLCGSRLHHSDLLCPLNAAATNGTKQVAEKEAKKW